MRILWFVCEKSGCFCVLFHLNEYLCRMEIIHGIVLRTVRYNDTSQIVDLFTDMHGYMSFVTKQSRSRRKVVASAFWQPLSMLEFQADIRPVALLPRPIEVRFYYQFSNVPYSPAKTAIALFIAEFLSAALREEKQNVPLFKYIENSLQWFDEARVPSAIANFHLVFLMHISRFLGIYPNFESPTQYFDLLSGTYLPHPPFHRNYLKKEEAAVLPLLFRMNYSTAHLFKFSSSQRQRILEVLNTFYCLHLPNFPELKSLQVLHEVFT